MRPDIVWKAPIPSLHVLPPAAISARARSLWEPPNQIYHTLDLIVTTNWGCMHKGCGAAVRRGEVSRDVGCVVLDDQFGVVPARYARAYFLVPFAPSGEQLPPPGKLLYDALECGVPAPPRNTTNWSYRQCWGSDREGDGSDYRKCRWPFASHELLGGSWPESWGCIRAGGHEASFTRVVHAAGIPLDVRAFHFVLNPKYGRHKVRDIFSDLEKKSPRAKIECRSQYYKGKQ